MFYLLKKISFKTSKTYCNCLMSLQNQFGWITNYETNNFIANYVLLITVSLLRLHE